jgi:hypothetical protein
MKVMAEHSNSLSVLASTIGLEASFVTVSQPETVVLSKRFLATREPSKISLIAWLCFVPLAIMYRRIKSCWC